MLAFKYGIKEMGMVIVQSSIYPSFVGQFELENKKSQMMANLFFISVKENNNNFAKKKFCVIRGLPWASFKHTKTFFGKTFYHFFSRL